MTEFNGSSNGVYNSPPKDNDHDSLALATKEVDFREYIDLIVRRRWTVIGVFLLFVTLGIAYTLKTRPVYEASAQLVVVTQNGSGSSGRPDDILGSLSALTSGRNVGTQMEILGSIDLLEEAFDKLTPEQQAEGFRSHTIPTWAYKLANAHETDVITITCSSFRPQLAALLANQIAQTYLDRDLRWNNQAARQARSYVETEMGRSKQSLSDASRRLADYKRKTGLISASEQIAAEATVVVELRGAVDKARTEYHAAQRRLAAVMAQMNKSAPEIRFSSSVQQNPEFAGVVARISALQGQRAQLLQEYTPTSPEVRQLDQQIRSEELTLRSTAKTIVGAVVSQSNPVYLGLITQYATESAATAAAEAELAGAESAYQTRQSQMSKYPVQQRDLTALTQEVEILQRTFNMLSDRYYNLLIQEKSNLPNGKIASRARLPIKPASPQVARNIILYSLIGALVAVGAAFVVERLDTRVHDPHLVERITGFPTLSAVPDVPASEAGRPLIGSVESHNSAFLESFRMLRNNITFSAPDRRLNTLAVTSPGRGEGKSTTSINLAIAFAMDGKRVLLIDGDLRRPSLHVTLGLSRDVGLTTVVRGLRSLDEAVLETEFENVFCLTSGPLPPNPTEFLNSAHCRQVIEQAKREYDLVLIDSPPCSGLSDMQVISTLVDGVVLVVALNVSQRQQLLGTMHTLRQAGAPMLGISLNRVDLKRPGYGYYSYYYYYGYEEDSPTTRKSKKKNSRTKEKV